MTEAELGAIHANADLAVSTFKDRSGIDFGFNRDSVAWLDRFIEQQRHVDSSPPAMIVAVLGSHLGQSMIAAAGGAWDRDENDRVGIRFDSGDWSYPFEVVAKQIQDGGSDGFGALAAYDVTIQYIATGRLPGDPAPRTN
jgi:hypothetical protein